MIEYAQRLLRRKGAYQRLFPVEKGQLVGDARVVMADLVAFCKPTDVPLARDETGATDALQTGIRMGRAEVFNRIRAMIHVDDRHLFNLKEDDE